MSHGGAIKQIRKPYWYANKQGFISVYALLLLSIFLAFILMLTEQVKTFTAVMQQKETIDFIDLHIIKVIKRQLKNLPTHEDNTEDSHISEMDQEETEDYQKKITEQFEGCSIIYEWQDEQVTITYHANGESHHINVTFNLNEKYILTYVYE